MPPNFGVWYRSEEIAPCVPEGADPPTFESLPRDGNFIFFLDRVLTLDEKGQNLKAQLSTLIILALIFFWKSIILAKVEIFLKIRY